MGRNMDTVYIFIDYESLLLSILEHPPELDGDSNLTAVQESPPRKSKSAKKETRKAKTCPPAEIRPLVPSIPRPLPKPLSKLRADLNLTVEPKSASVAQGKSKSVKETRPPPAKAPLCGLAAFLQAKGLFSSIPKVPSKLRREWKPMVKEESASNDANEELPEPGDCNVTPAEPAALKLSKSSSQESAGEDTAKDKDTSLRSSIGHENELDGPSSPKRVVLGFHYQCPSEILGVICRRQGTAC